MKLRNKVLVAMTTSLIAGTAVAANANVTPEEAAAIAAVTSAKAGISAAPAGTTAIDFRHEYKADDEEQSSRIKLGHSYTINDDWKGGVGIEMKFASEDATDFFNDLKLTETELDLSATYKVNKNWALQPGMPIAMTSTKTTIKPQFRVIYKSDFGLTTALRYRYEIANFTDGNGDTDMNGAQIDDPTKSKLTLSGGYKFESLPKLNLSYEANYWVSHDDIAQFDGEDSNYDLGLKAGYRLGDWQPFGEIWNSSVDSTSDDRQVKLRVGVKYFF